MYSFFFIVRHFPSPLIVHFHIRNCRLHKDSSSRLDYTWLNNFVVHCTTKERMFFTGIVKQLPGKAKGLLNYVRQYKLLFYSQQTLFEVPALFENSSFYFYYYGFYTPISFFHQQDSSQVTNIEYKMIVMRLWKVVLLLPKVNCISKWIIYWSPTSESSFYPEKKPKDLIRKWFCDPISNYCLLW